MLSTGLSPPTASTARRDLHRLDVLGHRVQDEASAAQQPSMPTRRRAHCPGDPPCPTVPNTSPSMTPATSSPKQRSPPTPTGRPPPPTPPSGPVPSQPVPAGGSSTPSSTKRPPSQEPNST